MRQMIKIMALFSMLFCSAAYSENASQNYKNNLDIAKQCKQTALKLDWLGRYQDRVTCTTNLDGASVYVASQYILDNQWKIAGELIYQSIVLTNYAIDIGCNGQNELKLVVENLKSIQKAISQQ